MKKVTEIMKRKEYLSKNGLSLPYRLYVPESYRDSEKYKLLIYLHGAGERGDDNEKHIANHDELISRVVNDKKTADFTIVIAPQCPDEMQWVDTPWDKGSYNFDSVPISKPMEALDELYDSILSEFNVDVNCVYIAGMSIGGYGTWNMLIRHPERFAAALPVCGGADINKAETIKHIPIRTYHNADDSVVPVSATRDIVLAMEKCGADIRYTESSLGEHNSWHAAYTELDLLDWMFTKSL